MSRRNIANTAAALAVATAISAAGILVSASADAAPPCENWFYPTEDFGFEQNNNIAGRLTLRGDTFLGPASYTAAGKPSVTGEDVTGGR